MSKGNDRKPIAVYYEHPEWFKPLFAELERRGISYEKLLASAFQYDPTVRRSPYSLIVNRMSPSAHTRGNAHAIFSTLHYLSYLKSIGANVLNGYDAYLYEFSKARQVGLLEKLGICHPRARVINSASLAPAAAEGLLFPVILKPNIGGSGAMIVRFNSKEELSEAAQNGHINLGIDQTALIQEYLPAENSSIIRVEILDGEFLYAIRLFLTAGEFNLCPADYCLPPVVEGHLGDGMADGVSGRGIPVEAYTPPDDVINDVLRIASAAHIEVGGVEYLINERDGDVYYYDINALSNFVADAPNIIGFDPFPRLVDFIVKRARIRSSALT
ncbi:MAG: hypothetical protein E3J30_09310 [Anaerolineales bacterium]|nr:MAG: hypothetical protein E3J30_09310 [Anaerolineales bacterium]